MIPKTLCTRYFYRYFCFLSFESEESSFTWQYNYLRRHVSLRADSVVELNVDGIRDYVVPGGQSEVAYGAGTINLHKDIF